MTTGRNLAKSLQLEQDTHAISIDYSPLDDFPAFSFASLRMNTMALTHEDALLIVDAQNDFLSGGNLAVPAGNEVIPALNGCIELFSQQSLPIFATRDWHPADHWPTTVHSSHKAEDGLLTASPVRQVRRSLLRSTCPATPSSFLKQRRLKRTPIPVSREQT